MSDNIRAILSSYTGTEIQAEFLDVVPDPKVSGVYAARVTHNEDVDEYLITLVDGEDPDDCVEECEFTQWPPHSGGVHCYV